MARVSIIVPTYNRADTILRAVRSVQAQTFTDWELVIVDDGSTDGTADLLPKDDARIRVIRQPNGGIAAARTTGMNDARGELIGWLDSDDEFLPHHLQLATAFFDAHPREHFFTGDVIQDWGHGFLVRHFEVEYGDWYPHIAARIGSRFADPPPEGDPYLRIYDTREPIGPWGAAIAAKAGYPDAYLYRGSIFSKFRWGFVLMMQPTVITREALESVPPLDRSYPVASDLKYLALLCKRYRAHHVSVPLVRKHEQGEGAAPLAEPHLVYGRTAVQFHEDLLRCLDELFLRDAPNDPELLGIQGSRQYQAALAALRAGDANAARRFVEAASHHYPGWDTAALRLLLATVPNGEVARRLYESWSLASGAPRKAAARVRAFAAAHGSSARK